MVPMLDKMQVENEAALTAIERPPGRIARSALHLRSVLGAKPIQPPVVDPQLTQHAPIERAAEVVRYSIARAEYWLSPGGTLRGVLRLCIRAALLIGLPAIIVGPVVLLLLEGAVAASASLAIIAANLAALSISLITAVIGFAVLIALVRSFLRRK